MPSKEKGVVYVGSAEAPSEKEVKKLAEEQNKVQAEKQALSKKGKEKIEQAKDLSPKAIISEAAQEIPLLDEVLKRAPVNSPEVQQLIANKIMERSSLTGVGLTLKAAVQEHRFSSASQIEARKFIQQIAIKTGDPRLIVEMRGGATNFELYREGDLPEVEEPESRPDKSNEAEYEKWQEEKDKYDQHEKLKNRLQEYQSFFDERTLERDEEIRYLERIANDITKGYTQKNPDFSKDEARPFKDKIEKRLESLRAEKKQDRMAEIAEREKRKQEEFKKREDAKKKEYEERDQLKKEEHAKERAEAEERWKEQQKERHTFSSIYLSPEAFKAMMDNPEWKIEEMLRQIEKTSILFPDTPAAEAATRQLQLMNEYIANAQYIFDVEAHIEEHPSLFPNEDAKKAFRKKTFGSFEAISEKVSIRTSIHKAYGMIRGVGDPETIWKSLLTVGTRGFEHLLNENGGLNEIAFNKYVTQYKLARFDDDGKLRRILPEDIKKIRETVIEEMRKEKDLYKHLYKPVYERDLTDSDCEAIVRQAEFAVVLSQQDLVAMLGALGPGETGTVTSFLTTHTGEKMLAAMDINRWFFEKWTNLTPGQRTIWENGCRIAVESTGKQKYIEERLRGVRPGTDEFRKLVKEVVGIEEKDDPTAMIKEVRDKLKAAFEFDKSGHQHKDGDYPTTIDEVKFDQLRDRLTVMEGKKMVGELLEVYDHFSSGWRISIHLEQLKRIYGYYGYDESLALGMRLRKAGNDRLHAETKTFKQREEYDDKLKKELEKVAKYRPQALLEFLTNAKDDGARVWFEAHKVDWATALGLDPNQLSRVDQLYKYLYPRFISVNELLADKGLPPLDYSSLTSIDTAERSLVAQVLGNQLQAYLNIMNEISGFVSGDIAPDTPRYNKLMASEYDKIYYRTQWIDDGRLRYLERPGQAPGRVDENYSLSLSELFTERGMSDVDPLVRTWRDGGVGTKTVFEVYAALTPDEKTLLEKMVAIKTNVAQYSGHMPAFRAALYLLGGWGATAKTDKIKDLLFLTALPGSSAMRRLFGEGAPSMGLNELEELLEKNDAALLSKMELIAPETFKYIGGFLGISKRGGIFEGTRLPLYLYRARLWIALAALLVTIEIGKTAGEALDEKKH